MSQEHKEQPTGHPPAMALSPLRAQPTLYPLGWEEWCLRILHPNAPHIHPAPPGHTQHTLENSTEGKSQSSALLSPAPSSVQSGKCTQEGELQGFLSQLIMASPSLSVSLDQIQGKRYKWFPIAEPWAACPALYTPKGEQSRTPVLREGGTEG